MMNYRDEILRRAENFIVWPLRLHPERHLSTKESETWNGRRAVEFAIASMDIKVLTCVQFDEDQG